MTKISRQQLWMLLSFALYTKNDELVDAIRTEIKQRERVR